MGLGGGRDKLQIILEWLEKGRNVPRDAARRVRELSARFKSSAQGIREYVTASREAAEVTAGGGGLVSSIVSLASAIGTAYAAFRALATLLNRGRMFAEASANLDAMAKAFGLTADELARIAQAGGAGTLDRMTAMKDIAGGLESAMRDYADSVGKTADELSKAEQRQVALNYAQKVGAEHLEELEGASSDAAEELAILAATGEDIKTGLGEAATEGMLPLIRAINDTTEAADKLTGGVNTAAVAVASLMGPLVGLTHFAGGFSDALKDGEAPLDALVSGLQELGRHYSGLQRDLSPLTNQFETAAFAVEALAEAHSHAWKEAEKHAGAEKKAADALKKEGELSYDVFERMADLQRQAEEARRELTGGITGKTGAVTVGATAEDKLAEIRANKTKLIFEIITEGLSLADTLKVAAAMGLETVDAEMEAAIREAAEINARLRAGTLPGGAAAAGGAGAQLARGHTGTIPMGMVAGAPTTGLGGEVAPGTSGKIELWIGFDRESLKAGVQKVIADDHIAVGQMAEERSQGGRVAGG